jgi:hypothetical protein
VDEVDADGSTMTSSTVGSSIIVLLGVCLVTVYLVEKGVDGSTTTSSTNGSETTFFG